MPVLHFALYGRRIGWSNAQGCATAQHCSEWAIIAMGFRADDRGFAESASGKARRGHSFRLLTRRAKYFPIRLRSKSRSDRYPSCRTRRTCGNFRSGAGEPAFAWLIHKLGAFLIASRRFEVFLCH